MLKSAWLRESCGGPALEEYTTESSLAAMARLEGFRLEPNPNPHPNASPTPIEGFRLEAAVRGPYAIGTQLEERGFAAVPSASTPHPCRCGPGATCSAFDVAEWSGGCEDTRRPCAYFWGAATTLRYGGGREGGQLDEFKGAVSATQLETPWAARASVQDIERFADAIADSVITFVDFFYGGVKCPKRPRTPPR